MAFNPNITPGNPPLLWSNIDEAFSKINENFDILVATIGAGSGLIPLDFNTLDTNVSPTVSNTYSLGSSTNKWRSVYTEEWSSIGVSTLNGVWLGTAQIKGISGTVDLPAGSTVNGNLIIDPDKTFFKSAQVDGGDRVEANEFSDTLNFLSGSGITMSVGSPGESITITNDGVITINGIDGITATTLAGITTISNAGVRSLSNIGALPAGRTVGAGIYIDAATGPGIKITNTGILGFDNSGFGTNVSVDVATGLATVNLSTGVVTTAAFRTIAVTGTAGQLNLDADVPADTLTLNAGAGIEITTNPVTDTISFAVSSTLDIRGSVFAQDSGIIVDSIDRKIYGDLIGNVRGDIIGSVFGDDSTKIIDSVENKVYATFFGNLTGNVTGNVTGNITGSAGSAGVAGTVDITDTNGLTTVYYPTFVENRTTGQTVRADVDLKYRTDTNTLTAPAFAGNLTGTVTGNIFTNLIDSADSSQIVVTPLMRFESDIIVENDLIINNLLLVRNSKVILLDDFKSLVAASTNFADFQARIAALA